MNWLRSTRQSLKPKKKYHANITHIQLNDTEIWLMKPNTYMNRSGLAVSSLAQFYKIQAQEILVVHDELDIPCGRIRFKLGGGNGGHNGLKDIQSQTGTPNFYRLRLGIDHPGDRHLVTNYVLSKPTPTERDQINAAISKSLQAIPDIVSGNTESATRFLHSISK